MKKIDFKTLAFSCLALGMLFAAPSAQAVVLDEATLLVTSDDEDDSDEDDYLLAAGCGAHGCNGIPSPSTGTAPVNGTLPSDINNPSRIAPNGQPIQPVQTPKSGGCHSYAALSQGQLEQSRRADLI